MTFIEICGRKIGKEFPPFVIVEIGINHEGKIVSIRRILNGEEINNKEAIANPKSLDFFKNIKQLSN